jgi:hypothetical protein
VSTSPLLTLPSGFADIPQSSARAPRTNPHRAHIADLIALFKKLTWSLIAASPATTGGFRNRSTIREQNLNEQPLTSSVSDLVRKRIEEFGQALTDALEVCDTMVADEEGDPVDDQTFLYGIQSLAPLIISFQLPPPLVLPLQNGGIGAEWHSSGMNIELRVRKPYDIYAVVEDARGVIPQYFGRDPDLVHARSALCELSTRVVAEQRSSDIPQRD